MKTFSTLAIILLLGLTTVALADKTLTEKLVTLNTLVDYDEEYNKALEEMLALPVAQKEKLSKDLSVILLTDKDTERRANAASAIGDMCSEVKSNVGYLSQSSKDKEKIVRQATVSALKRCAKTPETMAIFKVLSNDKEESVKLLATMALE